jgi:N-acetylmuramoyl-L-alanine amidase
MAPFMVLHKAHMPRVLVEMGFISNYTKGNWIPKRAKMNYKGLLVQQLQKNEYYGNGLGKQVKQSFPKKYRK